MHTCSAFFSSENLYLSFHIIDARPHDRLTVFYIRHAWAGGAGAAIAPVGASGSRAAELISSVWSIPISSAAKHPRQKELGWHFESEIHWYLILTPYLHECPQSNCWLLWHQPHPAAFFMKLLCLLRRNHSGFLCLQIRTCLLCCFLPSFLLTGEFLHLLCICKAPAEERHLDQIALRVVTRKRNTWNRNVRELLYNYA